MIICDGCKAEIKPNGVMISNEEKYKHICRECWNSGKVNQI